MNMNLKATTVAMGLCSAIGLYSPEMQAAESMTPPSAVQQAKKITGNICDAQGPLIGATVKVKGTTTGVATDFDGNFTLDVKPGSTLIISYVGYNTQEIVVNNQTSLNPTLTQCRAF